MWGEGCWVKKLMCVRGLLTHDMLCVTGEEKDKVTSMLAFSAALFVALVAPICKFVSKVLTFLSGLVSRLCHRS